MFPRAPFGGTTSSFGTSFGTPSTTTTGFGATTFGRPAFGNPQQTTSFGTSTTPFGAATSSGTSLFGSQPQQSGGGLFGQQPQQTSTSFSQPSTGFGTSGGGLFGQTQQSTSTGLFGSTGTSGFGTQQTKTFGFGQTSTTSTGGTGLFGTSQPSTGGGLFNTTAGFGGTGGVSGTTVKYEPVTGTDTMTRNGVSTNIRTRIEVISAMKEYENKSLEELRVEDYLANRKGPGQGTTLAGFGQTQQQAGGAGIFGSSTGTSLFGTSKPPENKSLFGTGTSTGFGTPTGGGLFGSGGTSSAFGQTSTAPSTSFSFGQNPQQQPKTTGFTFGSTPTSTPSLFGTPSLPLQGFAQQTQGTQQNTGGLFGNQNKPGGFLSNQTSGGGLFGNKPAQPLGTGFGATPTVSPFGATPSTSAGGGLFGSQNTQKTGIFSGFGTGGFGNTGLFGQNNQPKTGGLNFSSTGFGSTNTMNPNLNTSTGGGLFSGLGNTAGASMTGTGLFNSNTGFNQPQMNVLGGVLGGGWNPDLGKLVKALTIKPVYDLLPICNRTSLTKSKAEVTSTGDQESPKLTNSNLKPTYVLSSTFLTNNKPRPKPINKNKYRGGERHWLFKDLEDTYDENDDDFLKAKKYPSVKTLNLSIFKKKADSTVENSSVSRIGDSLTGDASSPTSPVIPLDEYTPQRGSLPPSHDNTPTPDIIKGRDKIKRLNLPEKNHQMNDTLADLNVLNQVTQTDTAVDDQDEAAESGNRNKSDIEANKENISVLEVSSTDNPEILDRSSAEPHPAGIKLSRSGYYTLPSLEDLAELIDSDGRCFVENFTVGRFGYGNVCFLGVTDVTGLDLDTLIFILRKQIEVYPEGKQKPPHGQELNKPAIVTLDCVWPVDKTTREVIKTAERLQAIGWTEYLERQCIKMDSSFLEYRQETGSWVFKVKHFSKYGLPDDEEEEQVAVPPQPKQIPPSGQGSQLTMLPARPTGPPPAVPKTSASLSFTSMTHPLKQVPQKSLDVTSLQDSQEVDYDVADSVMAMEPEEGAALNVQSPIAERLLMVSRIDAQTIQLAKSQLFAEDDEDSWMDNRAPSPTPQAATGTAKKLMTRTLDTTCSVMDVTTGSLVTNENSRLKASLSLQQQPVNMSSSAKPSIQTKPIFEPSTRDPLSEYQLLPSGRDIGREVGRVTPKHHMSIVPLAESVLAGQDHCVADMGAFMGRSFRIGWGPSWKFIHGGSTLSSMTMEEEEEMATATQNGDSAPLSPSVASFLLSVGPLASYPKTSSSDTAKYSLSVEKLHLIQSKTDAHDVLTESTLEQVLEYSIVTRDEISNSPDTVCPHFRPMKDVELIHQLAETAASCCLEDPAVSNIFDLCVALWGRMDFYSPLSDGESDYAVSRARVEAVSQWLEAVNIGTVLEEVALALNDEQDDEAYLNAIFSHLTARQISEACVLAQDKGDHHLALLLAQACMGQDAPRQILAQQLANWAEGGTDAFMAPARLVLYSLMAAAPTHQASHSTVNTCQGLDWRRAFALHLWYICPATSTIAEVLQEYEQAAGLVGDVPSYCEPPFPPYVSPQALPNGTKVSYDMCYHLMKLFTDPLHQLEALLNPATNTADPLNVSVSWVLWRVLESLGYHHLSEHCSSSLHLSMASLMESQGKWHWAAFVLLNIGNEERRKREVQELLCRHVCVGDDQDDPKNIMKESFITERLHIPHKWIFQAKAIKARSLNMIDEEAWYLLKAADYNPAHTLIVSTIAPNCVINEDHAYLKQYLDQLCDDGVHSTVTDWAIGGGIYADYLDVCSVVEEMKKTADPTPAKLEQLRPRLLALCSRLNNLKCPTATHRVCVSVMSRVVVGVLRAVVGEGTNATQVLSQQLSTLPLTDDYGLPELNMVTNHYLSHLATEN